MSNIVDLEEARNRLREKAVNLEYFDFVKEIEWAEVELENTSHRLDELSDELEDLTNYMVEITTYLGGLSSAQSILSENSPEHFMKIWLKFKSEVLKQSSEPQVSLTPEFDKE